MDKIGILGGTFDPVHNGHMFMARAACEELKLDKLLIIPAGKPYFKGQITPYDMRCEMVRLSLEDEGFSPEKDDRIVLSYAESDQENPTYTYQTLKRIRHEYPESELYFLCGMDVFDTIDTWMKPKEVLMQAVIAVFQRTDEIRGEAAPKAVPDPKLPPEQYEVITEDIKKLTRIHRAARCVMLNSRVPAVSSTQIRERIEAGLAAENLVSSSVAVYIITNGLYVQA